MNRVSLGLPIILSIFLISCLENNSYPGSTYPGYGDPYYGGYRGSSYGYEQHERRELERERWKLEQERRRLEEERRRGERRPPNRPTIHAPAASVRPLPHKPVERCPAGFQPSEVKCSSSERKKGCKDIRLPGGLGCVKR